MKTRSAKAKGRRLQNLVHDLLHEAFPELHEDDIRVVPMGSSGEDIQLSPAARRLIPASIECKNTEKIAIWSAIKQAETNANGTFPVVVFSRNRQNPYAVIPLSNFIGFLKNCPDRQSIPQTEEDKWWRKE